jgi:hypothetical protein
VGLQEVQDGSVAFLMGPNQDVVKIAYGLMAVED